MPLTRAPERGSARRAALWTAIASAILLTAAPSHAQLQPLSPGAQIPPQASPHGYTLQPFKFQPPSPQTLQLIQLEAQFADDVARGGGPAFARWFADDGVTLSNGQPPVVGREAIARSATWKPEDYKLTWIVEGAGMGPSGDAGYTWGHYDSQTTSKMQGEPPVLHSGRYVTFWKRIGGQWKVALEASADEPPGAPLSISPAPQNPSGGAPNSSHKP